MNLKGISLLAITTTLIACGGSSGGVGSKAGAQQTYDEALSLNDDQASAQRISKHAKVRGSLTEGVDMIDFYRIDLSETFRMTITLDSGHGFALHLEEINGIVSTTAPVVNGIRKTQRTLDAGTYFISVFSTSGTGEYILELVPEAP